MFSKAKLDPEVLGQIFGGEENVGKSWEKVWQAYPKLNPVKEEKELAPVRPDEGFYYVNGFERLISTMETEVSDSCFFPPLSPRRFHQSGEADVVLRNYYTDRSLFQCRRAAASRLLWLHSSDLLGRVG